MSQEIVNLSDLGESFIFSIMSTPLKINMEPENDGLEDEFPFPGVDSQVPC